MNRKVTVSFYQCNNAGSQLRGALLKSRQNGVHSIIFCRNVHLWLIHTAWEWDRYKELDLHNGKQWIVIPCPVLGPV